MITIPNIASYGSSYGKYGGERLSDYSTSSDINPAKLNTNIAVDGVQFNDFYQTINDYILAQLGYPTIEVEITPFQIKICIDEAISKLEYHAPSWSTQFAVFQASAGINVYQLPPEIINNLTYVSYKKDIFGLNYNPGSIAYDMTLAFFNTNKFFQGGSLGDFYLTQQYLEIMRRVLSMEGTWSVINNRELQLYPTPSETPTEVVLEYRAIDSNTIHHAYRNWIQRYALACAKGILGKVRGKYRVVPGPGGGAQLDGGILTEESSREKKELMEELMLEIEERPMFSLG